MATDRKAIQTRFGKVMAENIGHGCVSWRAPWKVNGVTDLPTGWYKPRSEWSKDDVASWQLFIDEVLNTHP